MKARATTARRLASAWGPRLLGSLLFSFQANATIVHAEPAIAIRTGYRCAQCHVNHTGGGMRTAFGSLYSQTILPARLLRWREAGNLLPADPDARFAVGGDVRLQYLELNGRAGADTSSFEIPEANLYLEGRLLPGALSLYLDAKTGPSGGSARELFALVEGGRWNAYLKAGKFLPPFGSRLPDDAAFIRQFSGFAYSSPDIGVEIGVEPGLWSAHLAVVNGVSGGSEENRAKQFSLLVVRRLGMARIGASGSNNIGTGGRTSQGGLMGGINLGRLALLGEIDRREDHLENPAGDRTRHRLSALVEGDLLVRRGLTIKLAHDWTDPDRNVRTDARTRDSLGVEYVPFPFLQLRLFARRSDGPPQVSTSRDEQVEMEAHIFF